MPRWVRSGGCPGFIGPIPQPVSMSAGILAFATWLRQ